MSTAKMKVLVVGPSQAGKTVLANVIADHSTTPTPRYHPTAGVRILEMEKEPPRSNRRAGETRVQIELWDCSGDSQYEKCYPIFRKDAAGIIFVFDPEDRNPEMDYWASNFPARIGLAATQCIAFAHYKSGQPRGNIRPPRGLEKVQIIESTLEDVNSIHLAFEKLFGAVYTIQLRSQEAAENDIMGF
jgi:Rab-like protein 5